MGKLFLYVVLWLLWTKVSAKKNSLREITMFRKNINLGKNINTVIYKDHN